MADMGISRMPLIVVSLAFLCVCGAAQNENATTSEGWLNEGLLLAANGSNEQALLAYERSIEIEPDNEIAWINMASVLSRLNRTDEAEGAYRNALSIFDEMIQSDPQNATLWASRGLLLHNVDDYEESVKAFDNATAIDPGYEIAWKMKGVILFSELSRYDEAIDAFDMALEINPNDPLTWQAKGDALSALNRTEEADLAYAKANSLRNESV